MSIPVFYGNDEDEEEAETVAQAINQRSDFASYTIQSQGVDWSDFEGIVLVGGQEASPIYEEATQRTQLTEPTQSNYRVIESVEIEGTPVLGIAGYTKENTTGAVNEALSQNWLNDFLGKSGNDREDPYNGGDDDQDSGGSTDPEPQGEKIVLEYSGAFGVADTVLGMSADGIKSVLNNKGITDRTGYTVNDVVVDKQNNEVEFYVTEVGSVTLLTAGLIIAGLLTASTIAISWAVKNVKETQKDKQIVEEKSDTKEALRSIMNSEEADEETKEQARKTLIEMGSDIGDDTSDGGSSGGSSGNGLLSGLGIKQRDILIIVGGALLLDELTSGQSRARTIIQRRR